MLGSNRILLQTPVLHFAAPNLILGLNENGTPFLLARWTGVTPLKQRSGSKTRFQQKIIVPFYWLLLSDALGCSESFSRIWKFYLCYCQGKFMERRIGTIQMLSIKFESRRLPI